MPLSVHHHSQPFDAVSWLARKYRVSQAHARVIAELNGFARRPSAEPFSGVPRRRDALSRGVRTV
jgi:hypothetical protein